MPTQEGMRIKDRNIPALPASQFDLGQLLAQNASGGALAAPDLDLLECRAALHAAAGVPGSSTGTMKPGGSARPFCTAAPMTIAVRC